MGTAEKIDLIVNPGSCCPEPGVRSEIYCHVQFNGTKLSIVGVVGPDGNDCLGSCGQIDGDFARRGETPGRIDDSIEFHDDWDQELWFTFLDIWDRWHLNYLRAGCEHQRALGWTYQDHHDPETYKGEACPTCGHHIGSEWLTEEVPAGVLVVLSGLPPTNDRPAIKWFGRKE